MALPSDFSPWEHFQSTLISVQNKRVREEFNDADDDDISTPRSSLKLACTLRDDDSAIQTLLRLWMFYILLRGASDLHPPIYTMPTDRYQQDVKFAPQVTLYFREDLDDVEEGYKPIDSEISFRVKNESYQTFSPADAQSLANRINLEFGVGDGYRWHKGRTKLSYRDKENGYQFSVNAYSESEGRAVISKVLSLQSDTLSGDKLTVSELGATPATLPPTESIYGKARRLPRRRPVGYVRFRYAECHVWGLNKAIILVDATGRRPGALVYT